MRAVHKSRTAGLASPRGPTLVFGTTGGRPAFWETGLISTDRSELARMVSRAAAGDRAAFTALFDAAAPRLFGLARRMVPDRRAAETILRDAFVAIGRDCAAFDPDRHDPLAWMARHVRDRAIERRRKSADVAPDDEPEPVDALPPPEPALAPAADRRRLRLALASLDEAGVHALRRTFLGGLSYRELARSTATTGGRARGEVRRALAAIRARMNEGKARAPERAGP